MTAVAYLAIKHSDKTKLARVFEMYSKVENYLFSKSCDEIGSQIPNYKL